MGSTHLQYHCFGVAKVGATIDYADNMGSNLTAASIQLKMLRTQLLGTWLMSSSESTPSSNSEIDCIHPNFLGVELVAQKCIPLEVDLAFTILDVFYHWMSRWWGGINRPSSTIHATSFWISLSLVCFRGSCSCSKFALILQPLFLLIDS